MLDLRAMRASKLQPAVLGGLFIGVLSALPIVNLGNCCCLWVIGGGLVAAWLLQQNQAAPIEFADAALVGLLAGLFGALINLVVSIPISLALGPMQAEFMQRAMENAGEVPEELRPMLDMMSENAGLTVVGLMMNFVFMLIIGGIFSTLGGMLGALFFRKEGPPPPPPPLQPDVPAGPPLVP